MNRGSGRGRGRFIRSKRWNFKKGNYGIKSVGGGSSKEDFSFSYREPQCSNVSTEKSDGPFKGWFLYFNEIYSDYHPAIKLTKSFEKFLKVQFPNYIQSEFEKQESFIVDVQELFSDEDLNEEDLHLREKLICEPELIIKSLSLTMHQILSNKLEDADSEIFSDSEEGDDERTSVSGMDWLESGNIGLIWARLINLDKQTPFKSLKANYFGKFVSVRGTVVRVSNIRPLCVRMAFTCTTCNQMQVLPLAEGKYAVPTKCSSDDCRGRVFVPERSSSKTETVNWQTIKILEISDDREEARVPRSVECELSCDLVGSCAPGDVVTLTGIVKVNSTSDGHARYQEDKCMFSLYIEVNAVQNSSRNVRCNDLHDVPTSVATSKLGVEFTERDLEFVREMHSQPSLYRLIVHSLCPAIYGHELVKAGLLLGLFGGTRKFADEKDRIPVRGDPHVLVVGDPGLGKSQMLQACANISPRGVYICGHNTTTAGLTVTLSREGASSGGCENMEAGALVLSDQGCCCIDEFDKMGQQQQQALLEAMEQQNVSVAKAGVLCNLTARTSILAAANPVGGHYNRAKTVSENLKLGSALLSRFDLVFILVDKPNEEVDAMLSEHVIAQRSKLSGARSLQSYPSPVIEDISRSNESLRERLKLNLGEPPLDIVPHELLRKYIAYARTYVHPRLSPAAATVLQQFYLDMRSKVNGQGSDSIPITLRQLESLIRLSEARARLELREEVSLEDAKDVIEILNYSMLDTFSDDLGNIHFERSQHGSGMSKQSLAKKFIAVLNNTAERTSNAFFTTQQMRQIAKDSGLQVADFEGFVDSLNNHGFLLRKGPKLYQLHTV